MRQSEGIGNDGNGVFIYGGLEGPLWGVKSEQTPARSESISLNNTSHSLFLICCINVFGIRSRTPSRSLRSPHLKRDQISLKAQRKQF